MQHKKMVVVPATTREFVEKTTCDICQKQIVKEQYAIDEVTIARRTGSDYPSGSSSKTEFIDMCGECFETKLKEWLKTMGVKVATIESDW